MYSLVNGFKQGFKNIFRNRLFSLASVGTIAASLFIFGVFFCIVANFQQVFAEMETSVGVTVFFNEGVEESQILEIQKQIETWEEVSSVHYTSPDEAWKEYKEKAFPDGESSEVLTNLDEDNPLANSASLEVYLKDASKQSQLVTNIEGIEGVRSVNASQSVADSVSSIGKLLGYVSGGVIIILLAVAIFLISNTVRIGITVRSEEIAIMKYLGATNGFVRAPFLVEGMLIGFIGSVIPLAVLKVLYGKVVVFVSSEFGILTRLMTFVPAMDIFKYLIPIALVMGLGIGFIGSWLTLIRHVRV